MAAALAGDSEAFGRLYDRYARLIRAVCFDTTQDLGQANDLCQETFLRAYRKLPELRDPEKLAAWLLAIARFVCREWKRGRARDRHRYVGLAVSAGRRDGSAGTAVGCAAENGAPDAQQVRRALEALPEDQRIALHLFYLQDQCAEQARAVLGLSRPGFYKLLARARQRLAKLLGPLRENHP